MRRALGLLGRWIGLLAVLASGACSTAPAERDAAGEVPADQGLAADARVDQGTLPIDQGTLPIDQGTLPIDQGALPIDQGALLDASGDLGRADAGAPAPDTGVPTDAGLRSSLSDEFDDAATMSEWSDLYPARHSMLNVNTSRPGFLTLVPTAQNLNAWYSENEGPLFYKVVTGNFVAETYVTLGTATDRTQLPMVADSYVQAGFVLRDRVSAQFRQRWIMYNLGYQDNAIAREIKTTVPSTNGTSDSLSTLNLNNIVGAQNQGALRVCRLGSVFRFYHRHPGSTAWTEEVFRTTGPSPTRVNGNGPRPTRADNSPLSFDRPDLPAAIQVGVYVGNYVAPPQGVRGEFDYVRFAQVTSVADCTRDF